MRAKNDPSRSHSSRELRACARACGRACAHARAACTCAFAARTFSASASASLPACKTADRPNAHGRRRRRPPLSRRRPRRRARAAQGRGAAAAAWQRGARGRRGRQRGREAARAVARSARSSAPARIARESARPAGCAAPRRAHHALVRGEEEGQRGQDEGVQQAAEADVALRERVNARVPGGHRPRSAAPGTATQPRPDTLTSQDRNSAEPAAASARHTSTDLGDAPRTWPRPGSRPFTASPAPTVRTSM